MSKRSATERIAVELLGWQERDLTNWEMKRLRAVDDRMYRAYEGTHGPAVFGIVGCSSYRVIGTRPDFTTLDGCAEFERAIDRINDGGVALSSYICNLRDETSRDHYRALAEACLFATPAQRVAACLRVLDEVKR